LGNAYSYSITTPSSSSGMDQSMAIWIDYNRDFDFDDPGEFVKAENPKYTHTGSITIAQNATPGAVIMRIRSSTNYSITVGQACTKFPYGETEDYTLNLTGTTQFCTLNLHGNSCGTSFNYYISNLNLATLGNTSSCGFNGYQDFTNLTANLERGQAYSLSITGSSNMGFGVWIDLNKDLSFDVNEFVYQSPATNTSSVTATLTLPSTGPLGTMRMRVRAFPAYLPLSDQACSFNSLGETEDYTVNISAPPSPIDAGVTAITKLKNSCGLGSAETVGIIVKNLGTITQTNFPVKYSVNGILVGTETVTKVLAPGDTTAITFSAKANLSIAKTHKIKAWTSLTADAQTLNDTTSGQIDNFGNGITAFPATETFESFVPEFTPIGNIGTGIFKNGWSNATDDNYDWLTSGPVTRAKLNKSASGDHTTGQGNYLNFFSYGSNLGTAALESPCITLDSLQTPALEFWYHMYGGTTGSLTVDVNVGGTWTQNVFTLNGSQQAQPSSPWLKASVPLAAYIGKTIRLRFRATLINNNSTAIAIDDVRILDLTAALKDVGVSGIITPTPGGCDKSATEQICVNLSNFGNTVRKNFTIGYKINNQNIISEMFADSLMPGQTKQFCFQGKANFSAAGTYKFRTFTQLAGDQDLVNDTAKLTITNKVSAANFTFNNISGSIIKFTTLGINTGSFIKWYFGDGDSSTVMMPTHQYLSPGTYTVKMVADDYQGCRSVITKIVTVTTVTGLSKEFMNRFAFFPNPTSEQITVTFRENAAYHVEIISLLGQRLINQLVPAGTTEIKMKVDDLPAGTYLLRITDSERTYTGPVIISK
jgi:archaellum component FlaF (FlaF/FlaG flagellin family)